MGKTTVCLILFLVLFLGCVPTGTSVRQNRDLPSTVNPGNLAANLGIENDMVFNPTDVELGLPDMRDLPVPEALKKEKRVRRYTGIIKNKTKYEVSVPAGDSSSTLVIPAQGWIEYSAWARRFDLTAYHDGKPFYCMKIIANPRNYPFMCKKYDFMIEIVKGKPIPKKKRRKIPGGVEALG